MVIVNPRPRGPRTLAARASVAETVAAELRARIDDGAVRHVTLLVPDPHARFAAVELGARFFADTVLAEGYGLCTYAFAWNPERVAVVAPVFEPYTSTYGDLRIRPDLCSVLPDGADGVLVVCDAEDIEFAPRTVLRRQVSLAESMGFVPSAGIEHEVTFTTPEGEPLVSDGLDYAAGGLNPLRPLLTAVRSAVDPLGVESLRGECHPGQYEVVLGHRDALAACDDAMLQQLLVRRVAAEHGVRAGYLAAERPGAGSSCHVHISLSSSDGFPLTHFVAGVLRAAPDLTPFWAPTWNSYVRLRTSAFSPRVVRWGVDDRTASVRVAGTGASTRAEVRFAGADAQPHLVVAAILAAGLWGIGEELAPPEPGELPVTPWAARAALASSDLARKLLGEQVVDAQLAHLDEEITASCDTVTDLQRRRGDLRA
ncbi:type I glutamate--ammonia ligase [Actinophytocola algeriensis]|uniref:Glutamine synthetase n=1 Tax=Actinophytocola algeriensis TaxID=1768010 RepID=A0A7W7VH05_9PSEU|nr:glutamine synthetase [Actinophytocola algeriensis]MBB4910017.1 glutamine synthetase [Actinophytocola algeriensis]MBE1476007.1 glutamine synthetase [Actinophytocola algeriensis]